MGINPFLEEHNIIREYAKRFVDIEVNPRASQWEVDGVPRSSYLQCGELGFFGARYSETYGGAGADWFATIVKEEGLGRSQSHSATLNWEVQADMSSPHIYKFGNDEQRRLYLPRIMRGEKVCALAVTEPEAGSDVANLQLKAEKQGGDFIIGGATKHFITGLKKKDGHADLYVVGVRTDPYAEKPYKGISLVLLESGTPGFMLGREEEEKHGMRGSGTMELIFDGCRVPQCNLIGQENKGFYYITEGFCGERFVLALGTLASAYQALDDAVDYARERSQFGKPIINFLQPRIDIMRNALEASRQYTYEVGKLLNESNYDGGLTEEWRKTINVETAMCKYVCAKVADKVIDDCLQFLGGYGYVGDKAIERRKRDARLIRIGGGADEVMLEMIIRRAGKKMPEYLKNAIEPLFAFEFP